MTGKTTKKKEGGKVSPSRPPFFPPSLPPYLQRSVRDVSGEGHPLEPDEEGGGV
jgi:hypothetical protein